MGIGDVFDLDDENDSFDPFKTSACQRLIKGVDLNDIQSGGAVFEVDRDFDGQQFPDPDDYDESLSRISEDKAKRMRNAFEIGPAPNQSFDLFAAEMKNVDPEGLVKKKVFKSGTGCDLPKLSKVTVHYNFYKEFDEDPFDSTYLRGRPLRFRLNNGEALEGFEMAVLSMRKGESSRFLINWKVAHGALGVPPRIPPECDVLADITLVDFTPIESNLDPNALTEEEIRSLNFNDYLKQAKQLHCEGNKHFSKGAQSVHSAAVWKALRILNQMHLANEEEERIMNCLKLKCLLNLAICSNKDGKYESTCVSAREALSLDPCNVKAMYYYGTANLHLSNFKEAENWLKRAQKREPGNADIANMLKKLNDKIKLFKNSETVFCQKAFGGSSGENNSKKEQFSAYDGFKEKLEGTLKEHFKSTPDQPYVVSGDLVLEEQKICLELAEKLNLTFTEDKNVFEKKEDKEKDADAQK